MGNSLNCARSRSRSLDIDTFPYTKKGGGDISPVAPDILPLEAAQFARNKRLSQQNSNPNSPLRENNNVRPEFTFEHAFRQSQLGNSQKVMIPLQQGMSSNNQPVVNNSDNCYVNIKPFSFPLPDLPPQPESLSKDDESQELIPCEEVTPPSRRKTLPALPPEEEHCESPKLPPRPTKSLHLAYSCPTHSSDGISRTLPSPSARKVEFDERDFIGSGDSSANPKLSPGTSVKKQPRKPPRNYSYKSSTLPKRISHTTEEVMELWDEVRKALSLEKLQESLHISEEDSDDDIDEIYQNLYAARMRSWQIMCLTQDILVERLKAERIWAMLLAENLMTHTDYDALGIEYCSQHESSQLIIDQILEHGDGWFDMLREELKRHDDQKEISNLVEALNEVFIIGAKANKWVFSLTTKHCSVSQTRPHSISDQPDLIGDTDVSRQPVVTLEIFEENFGNSSCGPLADVLSKYDVISQLNLGKNKISAKGIAKLSNGLKLNNSLLKLNLRLNPVENDGMDVLCKALLENHFLEELIMAHTHLEVGCGKAISQLLKCNTTLRTLNLSHNEITDTDCQLLDSGLQHNKGLTTLNLRDNRISAVGCSYLHNSLCHNLVLQYLDLSHNDIKDAGIKLLCDAIVDSQSLNELHVEGCGITKLGCQFISSCLQHNTSLSTLYLSNNQIYDEGCELLAKPLIRNNTIFTLYVNMCSISPKGFHALLHALCHGNTTVRTLAVCYNKLSLPVLEGTDLKLSDDIQSLLAKSLEVYPDRKIFTWGSKLNV